MRKLLTFLLGIACMVVLFLGHSYWNKKIQASSGPSSVSNTIQAAKDNLQQDSSQSVEKLLAYTSNWPTKAADTFKEAVTKGKKFKILFVGSPAIGSDTAGSYPLVKEKLLSTFGEKNIQVGLKTYHTTSTKFVLENKTSEIVADKADMIIFEPFILLNNGEVLPENTLKDLTSVIDDIKAADPDTTIILQPSYPLYQAKIYPTQVDMLKNYAKENQISYLDHWSAWPDPNSKAFKEYLTPDQSAPSKKGYRVWSQYLINYLIKQ